MNAPHTVTTRLLLLSLGMIWLWGCHTATPSEKVLLPEPRTEKYWLLNAVAHQGEPQQQHYCALVTQSPTAQGVGTAFFATRWSQQDSSFAWGSQVGASGTWSKPGTWPLVARLEGDSLRTPWRMHLGRKAFWLEGDWAAARQPLQWRATFPKQESMQAGLISTAPSIIALNSLPTQLRDGNLPAAPSQLQGAVFADASALIAAGTTIWLQLPDTAGRQSVFWLQDEGGPQLRLRAQYEYIPARGWLESHDDNAHFAVTKTWQSPHSGKRYPSEIRASAPYYFYTIRPAIEDQELRLGKRSFWMGAAALRMYDSEAPASIGNMYIFTR